jgi:prophage regulatory protein
MLQNLNNVLTERILRRDRVQSVTGLSRSTIYAEIKAGRFPKQVQLTGRRSVGWIESEVNDFISARIAASRNAANGGA